VPHIKPSQRPAGWNITATEAVAILLSESKLKTPFFMLSPVGIHIEQVREGPAAAGAPDLGGYGDMM